HAEQSRDVSGEPEGVRGPDQGRRHGVGDGQLHEAAGPSAGGHRDARPGELLAAVRSPASPVSPNGSATRERRHNIRRVTYRGQEGRASGPPLFVKSSEMSLGQPKGVTPGYRSSSAKP